MKRFVMLAIAVLCFISLAEAKSVTLSWDPSPTATEHPELNIKYKVYYDRNNQDVPLDGTGAYEGQSGFSVGNTLTTTVKNLEDWDEHFFAVTAYDNDGNESVYSNIVASPRTSLMNVDENFDLGADVFSTNDVIWSENNEPKILSFEKYLGGIFENVPACISGMFYYSDGSHSDYVHEISPYEFILVDDFTGELLAKQIFVFADDSYQGVVKCLFPEKTSTSGSLQVSYGEIPGRYEAQVYNIENGLPEVPPILKVFVKNLTAPTGNGPVNVVIGFEEPIPSPDKYILKMSQTVDGIMSKNSSSEVLEDELINTGEKEYSFNMPTEWQTNGFFVGIQAVHNDSAVSSQNYTGFLPGNVLGTMDDLTYIENNTVEAADVLKVKVYALYKTPVYESGEYPASALSLSDLNGDGTVNSADYLKEVGYFRTPGHLQLMPEW